jgi:hypothetical protein
MGEELGREAIDREPSNPFRKSFKNLRDRIRENRERKRMEAEFLKAKGEKLFKRERRKFLIEKAREQAMKKARKEPIGFRPIFSGAGKAFDKIAQQAPKAGQRSVGQEIFEAMSGVPKKKKPVVF